MFIVDCELVANQLIHDIPRGSTKCHKAFFFLLKILLLKPLEVRSSVLYEDSYLKDNFHLFYLTVGSI